MPQLTTVASTRIAAHSHIVGRTRRTVSSAMCVSVTATLSERRCRVHSVVDPEAIRYRVKRGTAPDPERRRDATGYQPNRPVM
jgi:hypothetical protein